MSMIYPIKEQLNRQIEVKDKDGKTTQTNAKFMKYTYKCRPQVLQRRQNWQKFGRLAKGLPMGVNKEGVAKHEGPVYFIDDEGQVSQQIEIAKQLMDMGKKEAIKRKIK